jgi:hypothetical protein
MATTEMTVLDERIAEEASCYVHWGPVIAGAVTAAALALVLHGFAAAIGLSVSSTSPSWRDASTALTLLAGIYLVFAALLAYGLGGYIAGRASSIYSAGDRDETEFRDGANGLVVWAFATLLTALIAFGAAQATTRFSTPIGQSSAAEGVIAFDLDRLFRSEQRTEGDMAYSRAEAGRVLLTASSHRGLQAEDHDYLVRLVGRSTGLAPADATRRVDDVISQARENIAGARRSAVILAFMAAAAALIGAVVAWAAASAGGRHRDGFAQSHLWDWHRPVTRIMPRA